MGRYVAEASKHMPSFVFSVTAITLQLTKNKQSSGNQLLMVELWGSWQACMTGHLNRL